MLSTLPRLCLLLALCHLAAGYRIWFPDSDMNDNYREGYYQVQRVPEQLSNSYMAREERQVEAGKSGPIRTQQVIVPPSRDTNNGRVTPSSTSAPTRPLKKVNSQSKPINVKVIRPADVQPSRPSGQTASPRPVLPPQTPRPAVQPSRPQATVAPVKTSHNQLPVDDFTDEEKEFDDYWAEDNLKAEQEVKKSPSACVWAIISCCKPTSAAADGKPKQQVRYNCFEAMNCHGAFWDVNPCSRPMMQAALKATAEFYNVKPKTE